MRDALKQLQYSASLSLNILVYSFIHHCIVVWNTGYPSKTRMFQLWWSFPVFMTLFTTDKAAKKPISYLSTKMWVVSSKMAIKSFFSRMCGGVLNLKTMVLLISLIQSKISVDASIDFGGHLTSKFFLSQYVLKGCAWKILG